VIKKKTEITKIFLTSLIMREREREREMCRIPVKEETLTLECM
jgi:hypothetical protein